VRKEEGAGSDWFVKQKIRNSSQKHYKNYGTTFRQYSTRKTFVKIQQGVRGGEGINRYDNRCGKFVHDCLVSGEDSTVRG
jgi:hypothetical protein